MAHVALRRTDARTEALRDTIAEILMTDESRRRFAAMMFGLDIHYDLGEGHPLLGRRMPDLDLTTADGPHRVYEFLHDARPLLLDLGAQLASQPEGVRLIEASYDGEGTDTGLSQALTTWFGQLGLTPSVQSA